MTDEPVTSVSYCYQKYLLYCTWILKASPMAIPGDSSSCLRFRTGWFEAESAEIEHVPRDVKPRWDCCGNDLSTFRSRGLSITELNITRHYSFAAHVCGCQVFCINDAWTRFEDTPRWYWTTRLCAGEERVQLEISTPIYAIFSYDIFSIWIVKLTWGYLIGNI